VVEFVVAHPQAVARLAGVHRIGAVGEGITHVFQGAGGASSSGGEQVWSWRHRSQKRGRVVQRHRGLLIWIYAR
jgi:hypothetical protein